MLYLGSVSQWKSQSESRIDERNYRVKVSSVPEYFSGWDCFGGSSVAIRYIAFSQCQNFESTPKQANGKRKVRDDKHGLTGDGDKGAARTMIFCRTRREARVGLG